MSLLCDKIEDIRSYAARPELDSLRDALSGPNLRLYLVGGALRDILLDRKPLDLDLASLLRPEEIRSRLERAGIRAIETGSKHQTVTAVLDGLPGDRVEITTFRGSGMSPEGGVVASDSIDEDLKYRDFTINALAYDMVKGELIDPEKGMQDLEEGIIRAVGDPDERFREDPLRVLRMLRHMAETGFEIDDATLRASGAFAPELSGVSRERIRDEFAKIILSEKPSKALRLSAELGFLGEFLPEISSYRGFRQNRFHKADLMEHSLEVVDRIRADLVLRLAALFHDVGKPDTLSLDEKTGDRHFFKHEVLGSEITRTALRRLCFSKEITSAVCLLVLTHMRPLECGPGGLRRLLRDTREFFDEWCELKMADALSCKLPTAEVLDRFSRFHRAIEEVKRGPEVSPLRSLAIDGHDVLAAGFREGPEVGRILRALHEKVLDDPESNTRERLLSELERIAATSDC